MKFMGEILRKWLGSRKVVLTVIGVILVILNNKFNLGLSIQDLGVILGLIAVYVLGESYKDAKVDANKIINEIEKHEEILHPWLKSNKKTRAKSK